MKCGQFRRMREKFTGYLDTRKEGGRRNSLEWVTPRGRLDDQWMEVEKEKRNHFKDRKVLGGKLWKHNDGLFEFRQTPRRL